MQRYYHYRKFKERLKILGFSSYQDYLNSNYWKDLKEKYRRSNFPKCCLACQKKEFILHHRSYARIGREYLTDLIPLCRDCHEIIHFYLSVTMNKTVNATPKIIRTIFRIQKKELRKRMKLWLEGQKAWKFKRY